MATVVGISSCKTKISTLKVSFHWKLQENSFRELMTAKLLTQENISTPKITFQSGILDFCDHYVQCFIAPRLMCIKISLGSINRASGFTNIKFINNPKVLTSLGKLGSTNAPFVPAISATAQDIPFFVKSYHFTDQDVIAANNSQLFWFYYNQNILDISAYNGDTIIINFEFDYCCWNKNDAEMELINFEKGEEVVCCKHYKKTSDLYVESLLFSDKFSDFTVHCGDKSFPCHKVILARKSVVLEAMLEQPMKEGTEGRLTINDFQPEIVAEFIRYIYTEKANVSDHAANLFMMSHKYQVADLKEMCESHLLTIINEDTFFDLYTLAKLYESEKLTSQCYRFFKVNRSSLLKSEEDVVRYSGIMLKFALE